MRREQIKTIRTSFNHAHQSPTFIDRFYKNLFDVDDKIKSLFPKEMTSQKIKMVEALSAIVNSLDSPGILATILVPLGRRHGPYGIDEKMLSKIFEVLELTVKSFCLDSWSENEACVDVWGEKEHCAWQQFSKEVGDMFMTGLAHRNSEYDNTPEILMKAQLASSIYSHYSQQEVDKIVESVCKAGFDKRIELAEMAVKETQMGKVDSKIMKNTLATICVWEDIKELKTVGIIDSKPGIKYLAQPMGVIFGIIPVTNPTSTTLFKILSTLKSGNSIIICGSRKAKKCVNYTAKLAYEAALSAGAPVDCIQWIEEPSREIASNLMSQPDIALILATGGSNLVKSAYSSGTPALGVGAGNVPVLVDENFDTDYVAKQIIASKTFDNGTICASEQAIACVKSSSSKLLDSFSKFGAYLLDHNEAARLGELLFKATGEIDASFVGQSAASIASRAGIGIPPNTQLLIVKQEKVGPDALFSNEKLCPVIALYIENEIIDAISTCVKLVHLNGQGHTAVIYSDDDTLINRYSHAVKTGRVIVNTASSSGAVGLCSKLTPSFTLGCGTQGKNITTNNISARDLINIQRIAAPEDNEIIKKSKVENLNSHDFNYENIITLIQKKRLSN